MSIFYSAVGIACLFMLIAACNQDDKLGRYKPAPGSTANSTNSTTEAAPTLSSQPNFPTAIPTPSKDSPINSQRKLNPQGAMSKEDESTAMPLPGQANDHSSDQMHPPKK